jgi:hypothetical protein
MSNPELRWLVLEPATVSSGQRPASSRVWRRLRRCSVIILRPLTESTAYSTRRLQQLLRPDVDKGKEAPQAVLSYVS